jgi:predicted RNA-binding protein with TRAM domain
VQLVPKLRRRTVTVLRKDLTQPKTMMIPRRSAIALAALAVSAAAITGPAPAQAQHLAESASLGTAASQRFDATDGQLADTGWPVGDTNTVGWAQAGRAGHGFCQGRGFVSGFLDGHQSGNLKGVVCVGTEAAQRFDATDGQLADTGWPVGDTNTVRWAQAGRAGHGFCQSRGFVSGRLDGHQSGNLKGVICLR